MIAHIVLFEPRPNITAAEQRDFLDAIAHAVRQIEQVQNARIGRVVEIGRLPDVNGGQTTYSFAAVFEFDGRESLAEYLAHPSHDLVRTLFWKHCAATLIVDVDLEVVSDAMSAKLVN